MIDLPDHLARRIRTAATMLFELSKDVPHAPPTVYGLVASLASGAPEAAFPVEDLTIVAFAAGQLEGLAVGLEVPLPLLLEAAGVERTRAADAEAFENAAVIEKHYGMSHGRATE